MKSIFTTASLRQLASRTAVLLTLGLALGSCDKVLDVQPQNNLDASSGIKTRQDADAALRGCYDALQSVNYYGLRYESFADLISGNIRHTGTFPTFAQIANNAILPDNVDVSSVWNTLYDGINRTNFFIQQVTPLNDPAYNTPVAIAEARALRALHYMNLLGYWGGSPNGYGVTGGLGVPLRLTPTLVTTDTAPIARATEADVIAAIREDLKFAVANLPTGSGPRIRKGAAIALQARLELRLRNYADALALAKQVQAASGASLTTNDNIFQLTFTVTDANQLAFFWFPSARGGRNEFDPSNSLATAHPAGDLRLPINVVTAANATTDFPAGTTRKYSRIASNDDPVNIIRYAEMVLTIAEAAAQTGDLTTATTQVNLIRSRAGLLPVVIGEAPAPTIPATPAVAVYITPTTADPTGQSGLIREILRQRRLELAHEGHYWFDLRRTNLVQSTLGAVAPAQNNFNQTFRNLWPIPQREVNNSAGVIVQNPNY